MLQWDFRFCAAAVVVAAGFRLVVRVTVSGQLSVTVVFFLILCCCCCCRYGRSVPVGGAGHCCGGSVTGFYILCCCCCGRSVQVGGAGHCCSGQLNITMGF